MPNGLTDTPEIKLVIAPHEFDKERLDTLVSLFKNGAVLMSEAQKDEALLDGKQVLVIDCFGLLSSAYAYCNVAYVGGGFGAGLHNINEAAVYDVPVFCGPNNEKFIEAGEMALSGVESRLLRKRTSSAWRIFFYNDRERETRGRNAGDYIRAKIGATDKIFDIIFPS